jgi:hypothetical protein
MARTGAACRARRSASTSAARLHRLQLRHARAGRRLAGIITTAGPCAASTDDAGLRRRADRREIAGRSATSAPSARPGLAARRLNLPRALVTEKAYPEDEAVLTTSVAADRAPGLVVNELVYEKRFGPRSQIELKLPLATRSGGRRRRFTGGLGDVALGSSTPSGTATSAAPIVSVAGEVVLPTGDEARASARA